MKVSTTMLAIAGTATAADLPSIVMKGSKLFYENGTQFFMKGVAYQQESAAAGETDTKKSSYKDPLSNESNCKRDVPLLKELGTNTIRTYAIDPEADHDACMKLLNDAGIYVISDLSEPSISINRDDPQWNTELLKRYTDVVDSLASYSNVIGFFAGNEVSNNKTNTPASAYVKAAVRDTKKHISDKGYRWLGVGYAANDDADIREDIADYFNCGEDDERIDYWGYNIYSWCGESDMKKSGYSTQAEFFKDYSVPVFFAEYGCNEPDGAAGRIFQETTALYSDEMTEVFSGGIVYMFHQEANDYGLVKVSDGKATKLKDFSALKEKVAKADPKGVESDDYSPSAKAATCPKSSSAWKASSVLPPTPDSTLCKCMVDSRSCVPADGLKAKSYGSIFGYICGEKPEICKAIQGNATTGIYGAYSMCEDSQKLAYVLDAYYQEMDQASDACDFDGDATTQDAKDESSCSKALASASSHNAQVATQTAASAESTSTTTSDEEDDESFGNPSASLTRFFGVGAYAAVALSVGAGMIML